MACFVSGSSLKFKLCLLSFVIFLFLKTGSAGASSRKFPVDAIYQFGDSLSDTGNLIRDNSIGAHSNFANLPYGLTTFHRPTGRCSDGLLIVDYFASFFNLPLLNPYHDRGADFTHGVNFAVAGSTALSTSMLAAQRILSPVTNSSLSVQLSWFRSHLDSICSIESECKEKLKKALFLMGEIGGNDYNYAFFQGKTMEELHELVPQVVQAIKHAVKEVISYGATRVVVPGNFPIGCQPIYLSGFRADDPNMYDNLKCLKGLNDFAKFHNDRLKEAIKELQQEYPSVSIVYGNYFSALRGIIQHASSLGFDKDNVQKACCGVGDNDYNFNLTRMCGSDGVQVCSKPNKYVSWDGVHLTQHAYQRMAKWLLKHIVPSLFSIA